jgi:hypothetical protein
LLAEQRASKGERWRGAYSNAESGYVRSPEIPKSRRRELAGLQYLRANGWENAGLLRKADVRTVAWSSA